MKDKIFKVIGEVTYILLKLTLAISIMILISLIVFEIKKEDGKFDVIWDWYFCGFETNR